MLSRLGSVSLCLLLGAAAAVPTTAEHLELLAPGADEVDTFLPEFLGRYHQVAEAAVEAMTPDEKETARVLSLNLGRNSVKHQAYRRRPRRGAKNSGGAAPC